MHIVHLYKTYFPDTYGGLEVSIRNLALATSSLGVKNTIVTVTSDSRTSHIQFEEGEVRRYKATLTIASSPISIPFAMNFRSMLRDADILHYHFPWPFVELLHLAFQPKQPTIVTYHSDIVRQRLLKKIYKPFMRRFFDRVNRIVVTSEEYLRTSEDLQPYKHKCTVIPLCLSENRFPPIDNKVLAEVFERHGKDFFLFVGVLRYYKGLQYLIRAMKDLPEKLIIVGDGPERRSLQSLAKELGCENVEFVGFVHEHYLPAYYKLARVVVLPSCARSEAFGMVLVEGLMFGKPLVSTEIGTGTSFVNKHGETGIVVNPKDPNGIREALVTLVTDDVRCHKYMENAKKRYEQLFTPSKVARKYVDLYRDILY